MSDALAPPPLGWLDAVELGLDAVLQAIRRGHLAVPTGWQRLPPRAVDEVRYGATVATPVLGPVQVLVHVRLGERRIYATVGVDQQPEEEKQ